MLMYADRVTSISFPELLGRVGIRGYRRRLCFRLSFRLAGRY